MTTASQIITDAMGLLGLIGSAETVGGNDAQTALRTLNRMLDGWRQQPHLATHAAWVSFTLPANTATRTIGPAGQVAAERPITIEVGGYSRFGDQDQPIHSVSRDKYASISQKADPGTWPEVVYYEAASPAGTLYFWPVPSAAVTVFLPVRSQLARFANLTTDYTLPDGYEAAIVPSLAIRMAPIFERAVSAGIVREANAARQALKRANASVPELDVGVPVAYGMGAFNGG